MNTITITGRLEGDPVRKETGNSVVTAIRVASGRPNTRGGRLWIDIDTWGRLAGTTTRHATAGPPRRRDRPAPAPHLDRRRRQRRAPLVHRGHRPRVPGQAATDLVR